LYTTHYTHYIYTGIDRLERLKGIPLKLMAIDQFMVENPQWLGKIVFGLIGISAVERGQVCICIVCMYSVCIVYV
jgi:trehalose-6-phosphate synthase